MDPNLPGQFDLQTVALLREALDQAWASIRPEQQVNLNRTLLAEGILKLAAQGERNPDRLVDAALRGVGLAASDVEA